MFLAGFGLSQTSLHLFVLKEVLMKHVLKVIKCLEWRCSSSAVGLWGFSNWIPHFLFYYAYFPHQCISLYLYLFLSVLIVVSGDVVHSPLWDRYSKISAENPERSFTQSQYKHEWKCVCSACVCLTIPQNHLTWKNVFIWNWLYWLYSTDCIDIYSHVHTGFDGYILNLVFGVCTVGSLICMTDCSLHSWPAVAVPVALNEMCSVCFRKC